MKEKVVESRIPKGPKPGEPYTLLLYVYELTSARMEPVHDSVFNIPAGFRLEDRK